MYKINCLIDQILAGGIGTNVPSRILYEKIAVYLSVIMLVETRSGNNVRLGKALWVAYNLFI